MVNYNKSNRIFYPKKNICNNDNILKDTKFLRQQSQKDIIYFNKHNARAFDTNAAISNNIDTIKIVLYTPPPTEACGGIMVLHHLAQTINNEQFFIDDKKVKAYLYYYDHKWYNNNYCNLFFNPMQDLDTNTIVIYPETIYGNPLGSKNVVRWILLDLGLEVSHNHYKFWDKTDLVYHWEPSKLKNSRQLVNIWHNPYIKRYNYGQRSNECYALKKMKFIPDSLHTSIQKIHSDSSKSIDDLSIEDTIAILNESSIFYCYDPNTFLSIMAPLCGCVTVLHPIDGIDRDSYFKSRILCHPNGFCFNNGISYGDHPDSISEAFLSLDGAVESFDFLKKLYKQTVYDFIDDIAKVIDGKTLQNTVKNVYYT